MKLFTISICYFECSFPFASVWVLLVDLKWSDPFDSDHSPKTFLVLTDKAESLEGHCFFIINTE